MRGRRLIPPHQSLSRQLPPEGKPSRNPFGFHNEISKVRRSRSFCVWGAVGYNALHERRALYCRERPMCRSVSIECNLVTCRSALCYGRRIAKVNHNAKPYLPCSLGVRKASPRGEAVATATDEGGSICTYERYTHSLRIPPTNRARQPHPAQNPHLPDKQKNFPTKPRHCKKRNKLSLM